METCELPPPHHCATAPPHHCATAPPHYYTEPHHLTEQNHRSTTVANIRTTAPPYRTEPLHHNRTTTPPSRTNALQTEQPPQTAETPPHHCRMELILWLFGVGIGAVSGLILGLFGSDFGAVWELFEARWCGGSVCGAVVRFAVVVGRWGGSVWWCNGVVARWWQLLCGGYGGEEVSEAVLIANVVLSTTFLGRQRKDANFLHVLV
ncbi:unnamed protein product [Lupinus luteus]|uniref:Uncharacterized protein n=1 Tax=Lupinus luteus TaxID=3873 RepID=A0AAV1XUC5_LUPLU